jgi:hypothetical protein
VDDTRCPDCGGLYALLGGRAHRCSMALQSRNSESGKAASASKPDPISDNAVKAEKPSLESLKAAIAEAGKRGRGRPKSEAPKPWKRAGMSRSAFSRKKTAK